MSLSRGGGGAGAARQQQRPGLSAWGWLTRLISMGISVYLAYLLGTSIMTNSDGTIQPVQKGSGVLRKANTHSIQTVEREAGEEDSPASPKREIDVEGGSEPAATSPRKSETKQEVARVETKPAAPAPSASCPRWVDIAAGKRVDACDSRVINNLHLINAGPEAWQAYADRVKAAVDVKSKLPGSPLTSEKAEEVVAEAVHAAQLWKEIRDSQTVANPAVDCKKARVLLLEYPINGFASAFGLFGGAIMQARLRNRILILDERGGWAYNGGPQHCPDLASTGQWGCYFQPVGNCHYGNADITEEDRKASKGAGEDGSTIGEVASA